MKFRKKPVVIEAKQFLGTPESANAIYDVFNIVGSRFVPSADLSSGWITIPTLEGSMIAAKGDWIIMGVKGEFYPCKPDIFEATYEMVKESE